MQLKNGRLKSIMIWPVYLKKISRFSLVWGETVTYVASECPKLLTLMEYKRRRDKVAKMIQLKLCAKHNLQKMIDVKTTTRTEESSYYDEAKIL